MTTTICNMIVNSKRGGDGLNICSVILAGGQSSRMGTNKALLPLHGKTVIEHISEELQAISDHLVIVANHPSDYQFLGVPIFRDRYKNRGPLAGIETVMYHTDADFYVIAACDMPFINRKIYTWLLEQLHDFMAVIPMLDQQIHPLTGIYHRRTLPYIQHQLEKNELQVKRLLKRIKVNYVTDFPDIPIEQVQRHFFNMNHPDEYEEAKSY